MAKPLIKSNASGDLSPPLDSRRRLLKTGLLSWGVLALGGGVSVRVSHKAIPDHH